MIKVKWDITGKCNLRCVHCCNSYKYDINKNEMDFHEIQHCIDELTGFVDNIQFLGGEPFCKPNFMEVVDYIDKKGISVGINTNGLLISEEIGEALFTLKNKGNLSVSLEGVGEFHDQVRGTGVFNKIITNINRLNVIRDKTKSNFIISATITVSKIIADKLGQLQYFIDNKIFDALNFDFIRIEGMAISNADDLKITEYDRFKVMEYIMEIKKHHPLTINAPLRILESLNKQYNTDFNFEPAICLGGTKIIYLDPYGTMVPCNKDPKIKTILKEEDYNLLSNSFENIYNSEGFREFFRKCFSVEKDPKSPLCVNCKFVEMCRGCPLSESFNPILCEQWEKYQSISP